MGSPVKGIQTKRRNRMSGILQTAEVRRRDRQGRGVERFLRFVLILLFFPGTLTVLAIAINLSLPRETTFSLNAVTQVLDVTVSDLKGITALLPEVRIIRNAIPKEDGGKNDIAYTKTIMKVPNKTKLILERKTEGDLLIRFTYEDADSGLVKLIDTREGLPVPFKTGDSLRVIFEGEPSSSKDKKPLETLILPIQGNVQIGRPVAPMRELILLEGKVAVFEQDPFSGKRYLARESQLEPGDVVNWKPETKQSPDNIVRGFAHVGIGQGIRLIANTNSEDVQIERFGASPYGLSPSLWDRVAHDPVLGGMLGLLAALGGLITVFEVLYVTLAKLKNHA